MSSRRVEEYQRTIGYEIYELGKLLKSIVSTKVGKFTIQYRVKNERTISRKMFAKNTASVFFLRDIYAFRILVKDTNDCYMISQTLMKVFPWQIYTDFIISPIVWDTNSTMYQALQLVFLLNSCKVEVQVMTPKMHIVNEKNHHLYKEKKYRNIK